MPFWQQASVTLTDPVEMTSLRFPTAPEEITSSAGTQTVSTTLDNFGTLTRPSGRRPTTYSWKCTFYGGTRFAGTYTGPTRPEGTIWTPEMARDPMWNTAPYITRPAWRPPEDIKAQLERWHDTQPKRPPLRPLELVLYSAGFPRLYKPVYIDSLDLHWRGAWGDLECEISLTEWRSPIVGLDTDEDTDEAAETAEGVPEDEPPVPWSITVQPGDSLWALAKLHLGDGARYPEIYALNSDIIGPDPNLIHPGQELLMPGGEVAIDPEPVEAGLALAFGEFVGQELGRL